MADRSPAFGLGCPYIKNGWIKEMVIKIGSKKNLHWNSLTAKAVNKQNQQMLKQLQKAVCLKGV